MQPNQMLAKYVSAKAHLSQNFMFLWVTFSISLLSQCCAHALVPNLSLIEKHPHACSISVRLTNVERLFECDYKTFISVLLLFVLKTVSGMNGCVCCHLVVTGRSCDTTIPVWVFHCVHHLSQCSCVT